MRKRLFISVGLRNYTLAGARAVRRGRSRGLFIIYLKSRCAVAYSTAPCQIVYCLCLYCDVFGTLAALLMFNYDGRFFCTEYPGRAARRYEAYVCAFPAEPYFTVRGLCEDAVMDTQYKLASHTHITPTPFGSDGFCYNCNTYRSFVGPKGWKMAYNDRYCSIG